MIELSKHLHKSYFYSRDVNLSKNLDYNVVFFKFHKQYSEVFYYDIKLPVFNGMLKGMIQSIKKFGFYNPMPEVHNLN